MLRRFVRLALLAALFLGLQVPALAAVEIAFYSRELGGNNFPHAFVRLMGLVLAAIAVELMLRGIRTFVGTL